MAPSLKEILIFIVAVVALNFVLFYVVKGSADAGVNSELLKLREAVHELRELLKQTAVQPHNTGSPNPPDSLLVPPSLPAGPPSFAPVSFTPGTAPVERKDPQFNTVAEAFVVIRDIIFKSKAYECKDLKHVGGPGNLGLNGKAGVDGAWATCFDRFNELPPATCDIFSFGINGDFTFEDAISVGKNCTVNAFDPTMNVIDYARSERIKFWNMGLRGTDIIPAITRAQTLKQLLDQHNKNHLNFLKVDIEYSEWPAFQTAIDDNIFQNVDVLMFEIHFKDVTVEALRKQVAVLIGLHNLGFRQYWTHTNPLSYHVRIPGEAEPFLCCYELGYIRV